MIEFFSQPAQGWLSLDIALLALLAIALVVLGLVYHKLSKRQTGQPKCNWKRIAQKGESFQQWQCRTCGVEAYSTDQRPPKECKRSLKAGV